MQGVVAAIGGFLCGARRRPKHRVTLSFCASAKAAICCQTIANSAPKRKLQIRHRAALLARAIDCDLLRDRAGITFSHPRPSPSCIEHGAVSSLYTQQRRAWQ